MTLRCAFPLVLALAVLRFGPAAAQVGGMPGSPGMGSPFWRAPQHGPPPACRQIITLRDETQKHGQALSAAGRKKVPPEEVCKLFNAFLASETKMVKGLEENSATCGVPAEVITQVKAQHNKASQMAGRMCLEATRDLPSRFDAPAPNCAEPTFDAGHSLRRLTSGPRILVLLSPELIGF